MVADSIRESGDRNFDHQRKGNFEKQATAARLSGKREYEQRENGRQRHARTDLPAESSQRGESSAGLIHSQPVKALSSRRACH
ncbi:hypothetical protein [Gimesia sp.]|uniref:hypothetical protein n=1 Tax=Gimesia sp. TaxID=2024833 RepID=UPI0025BF816D|nr:hypothetical protein [Gimesia sp.]